jgi:hypothetical protein
LHRTIGCQPVDAAKLFWDPWTQSASLRQAAAVITAVGREISREVGQGMQLRFFNALQIPLGGSPRIVHDDFPNSDPRPNMNDPRASATRDSTIRRAQ